MKRLESETADPDYAFADKVGRRCGADLRTMDRPGESRVDVSLRSVKRNTYG